MVSSIYFMRLIYVHRYRRANVRLKLAFPLSSTRRPELEEAEVNTSSTADWPDPWVVLDSAALQVVRQFVERSVA